MKTYEEVDVEIHIFVTSALVLGESSVSLPCNFTTRERTHWIGDWVDPWASLDDADEWKFLALPGLGIQPLVVQPTGYSDCATGYNM
jgi:hypothetical protein